MLVANNSPSETLRPVEPALQHTRSWLWDCLFWLAGIVLAFVLPAALILGAILVSSYGITLPIEVRIP